ncbi:hypothetical protein ARTHRO9V_160024 [Arthrobacter sp. 9V]|nr:hypothetical protein ARTHRO9V_160024 [Arthrobacter sp. 9V]
MDEHPVPLVEMHPIVIAHSANVLVPRWVHIRDFNVGFHDLRSHFRGGRWLLRLSIRTGQSGLKLPNGHLLIQITSVGQPHDLAH